MTSTTQEQIFSTRTFIGNRPGKLSGKSSKPVLISTPGRVNDHFGEKVWYVLNGSRPCENRKFPTAWLQSVFQGILEVF